MAIRLTLLTACLLAISAPAQNLVVNGGFESSTLSPWTVTGLAINPVLEQRDVTGDGTLSQAYVFSTDPSSGHVMEQTLAVTIGEFYEIRVDFHYDDPGSNSGASVSLNSSLGSSQAVIGPGGHVQLRGRKQAAVSTATIRLGCGTGAKGRVVVDNVDVRVMRKPILGGYKINNTQVARQIGKYYSVRIDGTPGAAWFTLVGFASLGARVTVPGFTGDLGLDPATLFLVQSGTFGAPTWNGLTQAFLSVSVPANPSLVGLPIWLQAVEFNQLLGIANLGWEVYGPFSK